MVTKFLGASKLKMNEGVGTPDTVVPSRDAVGKGEDSLSGQAESRPEVVSATTHGMPEEPTPKAEPPLAGGEQFSNRPDKDEPPKVPRRDPLRDLPKGVFEPFNFSSQFSKQFSRRFPFRFG